MATSLDKESLHQAYEDVRSDDSETQWAVFKYDGTTITTDCTGSDFTEFTSHFGENDRGFGFLRMTTGDELSKRAKFVLITWVGGSLSALKRAKMGPDKALVKNVIMNFAVEIHTSDAEELKEEHIRDAVKRAGGANYGTGTRD